MPGSAKYNNGRWGRPDNRPLLTVPGEGPVPAQIMLIGERPGENEAKEGRPFVGLSGQYLERFLLHTGLRRQDIYITNLVKEFANWGKPTVTEIYHWRPKLVDEVRDVAPTVIGLLGTFAVENVLGWERAQLERTHGVPVRAVALGAHECICVPMYHPAAGIYSAETMSIVMDDIRQLKMVADGTILPQEDYHAGNENYRTIDGNGCTVRADCAIDTEFVPSTKRPLCLTYSVQPGAAYLQRPRHCSQFDSDIIYIHNSMVDLGVLRRLKCDIGDQQFRDTMVWAYLLQVEPQGLKDLAYRHCGMSMDSYNDIIATANYNRAIEYLIGVNACEWEKAEPYVVIEGGKARIKKPHSINQRVSGILHDIDVGKLHKNGDPVDPRQRWNDIEDYLKSEVVEELGPMPEATLDDVDADVAERYACRDSDATLRVAPILKAKIDAMGLNRTSEIDHDVLPIFDRMQHVGIKLAGKEFWDKLEEQCDAVMGKERLKIFEMTGADINPDSPKQTRELLFGQLGLTIKKMTKGGKNGEGERMASTNDKALEAIYGESPVVDRVLNSREASKIKNSYIRPLRKIAVDTSGDGRVHCTFRLTTVVTGRPSATNPNLLAIPVRSTLGREIRGGFVADEGRVIGDWDEDQAEMRYMADKSRDEGLVKLFIDGKRDVHTDTAALMFGTQYELVKKEQRYAAKRVGFGVITGITEYGLFDQMALARAVRPDGQPWSRDDCAKMIVEYFNIRPLVKVFMDDAGQEAALNGYVRDEWGRIRYLPGVWSPIEEVKAEAKRQASSFKIQAGAQGIMKQCMKSVWDYVIKPWRGDAQYEDRWPVEPILQIYDSMVFDMDERVAEEVGPDIVNCLTMTVQSDTGLPYTAKGGIGKTWLTT